MWAPGTGHVLEIHSTPGLWSWARDPVACL